MATVSTKFFNGSMTAADMKASYKTLAKKNHPDLGGDLETMKLINAEYAYWYATVSVRETRETKINDKPESREYYEGYYTQEFIDSLEKMIGWIYNNNIDRIAGLTVEIIGVFVWIGGVTAEMKETQFLIKSVGFKGSWKVFDDGHKAFMWKWTHEIRRFGSEKNFDTISRKYGSADVKRSGYSSNNSRKQIGS